MEPNKGRRQPGAQGPRKAFDFDTARPERIGSGKSGKEQIFSIPVNPGGAQNPQRPPAPRQGQPRSAPQHARRPASRQTPVRRKKKKKGNGCGFFLGAFVVILLLAIPITALIEAPGKLATADSSGADSHVPDASQTQDTSQAGDNSQVQDTSQAQEPSESTGQSGQQAGIVGPQQQTDAGAVAQVNAELVSLWENGRVDMSYFDDALFIGDSLTQGFQIYSSSFQNAKYAAYVGVGPKELTEGTVANINGEQVSAIDEILAANASKVYILLGTNSLQNLTDEAFIKYYNDFLDFLIPQLPAETVYYIQAIPPVSAEKAASDESYTLSRIQSVNDQLAQMAYTRGLNFINLYQGLAGDDGALRAEYASGDGIHLNDAGYDAWREYLITHTAYRKDNPYLPGSPLYVG